MQPLSHDEYAPQMARLDPRASRLKYRLERLMLTPLVRFALRVVLPFGLALGGGLAWFSAGDNRDAFNLMLAEMRHTVESRPEFQVQLMVVDGAGVAVSEEVRALLDLSLPVSRFDLDLETMQAQVTALDAVKSATLRFRQGGLLQVRLEERLPVALWRAPQTLVMLDAEGVTVGPLASRFDRPDLPVIAGEILLQKEFEALARLRAEAQGSLPEGDSLSEVERRLAARAQLRMRQTVTEALELTQVARPLAARLRGLERMGGRRWDLVLDRDQRIMLPETGAITALERTMAMDHAVDMLARDIAAIDLRLAHRPTIKMKEDAVQEMLRIKAFGTGGD